MKSMSSKSVLIVPQYSFSASTVNSVFITVNVQIEFID